MPATQEKPAATPAPTSGPDTRTIDRTAPAGTKKSLGAESVREGRPASDDSVEEAMDEKGPESTVPGPTGS